MVFTLCYRFGGWYKKKRQQEMPWLDCADVQDALNLHI